MTGGFTGTGSLVSGAPPASVDRTRVPLVITVAPVTVVQNLAMPFTLDVEPPPAEIRARALALAEETGLAVSTLDRPVAELDAMGLFSVRLARAVALDPAVLLFEHPTADIDRADVARLASRCRAVPSGRNIAAVTVTADAEFAAAAASRVLTLEPASGRLAAGGWLSRFRRA